MDTWDAEADAIYLHTLAGIDPAEPAGPAELACAVLGARTLEYARGLRGGAAIGRVGDGWRLYVRPGLPPEVESHAIGHELAEWHLRREYDGQIEARADRLGAALVAPRPALLAALRAVGEDDAALARAFVVTQPSAALRVAEVTGRPRAVVTRHWVFVRGAPWAWGQSAGDVRQLVRSRRPGLTRTRLRDRPERVVLLADDAA